MRKNISWIIAIFIFLSEFILIKNLQSADALSGSDISDDRKRKTVEQLYSTYEKDFPEVRDMQPADVMRLLELNKVVLIDVRTQAEMEISTLPGAITMDEYLDKIDTYKDFIAVAYCTIGYRSGMFAERMKAKEIEVKNLAGGILGWVFEGGRVYHKVDEVKRIHVYGPKWNYPPSGYESVVFSIFDRIF